MNKVICLMTSVRGGSKLLHYLLEDHPQISSFPRTFKFDDFWKSLESTDSPEIIINKFIDNYPRFFEGKVWKKFNILDKADELGKNRDETFKVDIDKFKKNFLRISLKNNINSKSVFLNLHRAYQESIGRVFNKDTIILYHIHAIENINSLDFCIKDFGINNTKVLFMTKHPLLGMRSIVKWMDNVNIPLETQPITLFYYYEEILKGYDEIIKLNKLINYKVLLLNNLIENKINFLTHLAKYIGIEWNESLLYPTILGKEWWGNSKRYKKGIHKNSNKFKPTNFLERKDWLFMKIVFNSRMKKYGFIGGEYNGTFYKKLWLFFLIFLPTNYEILIIKKFIIYFNSNTIPLNKKIIFVRNFIYTFVIRINKSIFYFCKNNI